MPRIHPTMVVPAAQENDFLRGGHWTSERTTKYVPSHVVSLFHNSLTKTGFDELLN